jgi:hypothetical protein
MFHSRDARIAQHRQSNSHNTTHKRIKDKNYIIISIDSEKAFECHHPFMIKSLKKLGIEAIFFNIIKAIFYKSVDNLTLNEGKTSHFLKSGMRQGCPVPHSYSI